MPTNPFKHFQIQQLAYKMARSGDYASWRDIEIDLEALGYRWARELFTTDAQKAELDEVCRQARAGNEVKDG